MKLRYFLRGLGIGVLVTAMVLMISHQSQGRQQSLTDEQIIEKAEALGMIVPEETESPAADESMEPSPSPQITGTPEPSPDVTPEPSVSPSPDTSPSATPTPTPKPPKKTPEVEETVYVSVSIEKGMWSEQVSRALEDAGLVESAGKFNKYLTDNDYASYISVGTYRIEKGATYQEIARIITKN